MDTSQFLVTVIGAGGGGAALLALINGIIKWLTGAAAREKIRNTDLLSQRRHAVEERESAIKKADAEAARRRQAEEYASSLRRLLIENDIIPPKWYADHDSNDTLDAEELKQLQALRRKKKQKETPNE